MKTCCRCKLQKEEINFCKDSRSKDGLCGECKMCLSARKKKYKQENYQHVRDIARKSDLKNKDTKNKKSKDRYYLKKEVILAKQRDKYWSNVEEIREKKNLRMKNPESREKAAHRSKKWREENKELYNAFCRIYRSRNKIKIGAVQKVNDALRRGTMSKPLLCEKCNEIKPLQGHHEDYSKPLEVNWLCRTCHFQKHDKLMDLL